MSDRKKLSARALKARDAERDIGAELLASVREMKAGKAGHVHRVNVPEVVAVRAKVGLSQDRFASMMGVSKRTLEGWEQGRREPTGAAKALLKVADRRPEVLRELFSSEG